MKREELLLMINKYHSDIVSGLRWEPDYFIKALRAVVELHKPFDDDPDECGHCGDGYPCITIQVIEKELG